ncbi:hypothetical protein DRP77_10715 [Candidatus Poribacteria bacterium]|nr:MAG: hypothetical protein DRP77_10715 [Candidatus Poribacteria bacterium]
MSSIITTCINI